MEDLMETASEIQETLGRSYGLPEDVDEDELEAGKNKRTHLLYQTESLFSKFAIFIIIIFLSLLFYLFMNFYVSFAFKELEGLGDELLFEDEETPSYLQDATETPSVPTGEIEDKTEVNINLFNN